MSNILKDLGNEYAGLASDDTIFSDITSFIDSGSYSLNALLSSNIYNGYASGRIVLVGSASQSGKSYLAISGAKTFLDSNPEGLVFYFESEGAITKSMLEKRGIDLSRFLIIPVVTIQEFRTQVVKIIDKYEAEPRESRKPIFILLDSMGMLSTDKEIGDAQSGSEAKDMTRASTLRSVFRVLTLKLGRANVPLFVTNHVYDAIGQGLYAAPVQSGGKSAIYAASTILTLSKAKEKDSSGNITGAVVTITSNKSRLTRENMKIKTLIKYQGGLDRYYGLLDIAEAAGVFVKDGSRYKLKDGTKIYGKTIQENPEKYYTKEILDEINEYVKEAFSYGSTLELPMQTDSEQ